MTADDAPRTLREALVRDLRSAAYDGAIQTALATTEGARPRRHRKGRSLDRLRERALRRLARRRDATTERRAGGAAMTRRRGDDWDDDGASDEGADRFEDDFWRRSE